MKLSPEQLASLCQRLNADPAFVEAVKKLEGRFVFEVGDNRYYLALVPGRCVEARPAREGDAADFVIAVAPEALTSTLDPVQAFTRGQLKLKKGSLFALMPFARAAKAIFQAMA